MKKSRILLAIGILTLGMVLTACGKSGVSQNPKNPKYTYGNMEPGKISEVYDVTEHITQRACQILGERETVMIDVYETSSGGAVACCGDMYVYSPDKADAEDVANSLYGQYLNQRKSDSGHSKN